MKYSRVGFQTILSEAKEFQIRIQKQKIALKQVEYFSNPHSTPQIFCDTATETPITVSGAE
jgi:hypothetical protein